MKKLTFALACASAFALFADSELAPKADFEAYEANAKVADTVEPDTQTTYWLYDSSSSSEDGSAVKAYGEEGNLATPTTGDNPGDKYLELSTEGGTLWRSLAAGNTDGEGIDNQLGAAQSITDGLYIDTMVQFTPTEDGGTPDTTASDKLAIWLDVDSSATPSVTNLMVRANAYTLDAAPLATPTTFPLAPVSGSRVFEAGTWYRLTVRAVKNVFTTDENGIVPGFEIRIDGTLMKAASGTPFSDDFDYYIDYATSGFTKGALFASLQAMGNSGDTITLQAVGFKGSGALDNLAFSTTSPLPDPGSTIDFTITAAEGMTVEWSTDNENWTVYANGASAAAGTLYVRLTNADGVKKVLTQRLSSDSAAFDLSAVSFGWADYLGEAIGDAYVIDDAAELVLFQKGYAAKLGTKGLTFKLGAPIALEDPWPGIGTYDNMVNADAFEGTFDGAGYTISNVVFADNGSGKNNYRGFFNQINNAVVKNLTVEGTGFGTAVPSGEYGCALVVGCANNSTIEGCVASGTIASGTHNVGGIVVRIKDATIRNCTNKATITGSYTKVGGIAVLNQNSSSACLIEGCRNEGTLTAAGNSAKAGSDGLAGIIAYTGDDKLTIKDCSNAGALVKGEGAYPTAKVGQMVGFRDKAVTVQGTNTALADTLAVGSGLIDGLTFATVANGTATFVANSEAKTGANLKVMAAGATVTLGEVGETITLDTSLASVTVKTSAENAEVKQEDNVYTVVSTSTSDDWPEDPSTKKGETANEAYGITGDLADAAADELGTWAKANNVAYADAAEAIKVEAFLLNVANTDEAIAEAKAAFKIPSITVAADGTVTVEKPKGSYNGVLTIKTCDTVDGEYVDLEVTDGVYKVDQGDAATKFFKAVLSVK